MIRGLLLVALGWTSLCWGAFSSKDQFVFLFMAQGDYLLASTDADVVSGATYTSRFRDTIVGRISLGVVGKQRLFLGLHYENWVSRQQFDDGSGQQTHTLGYHGGGPEVGLMLPTPRSFVMLSGAVTIPFLSRVTTNAGIVDADEKKWTYQIRVTVGLKVLNNFSVVFGGGYRIHDMGNFSGTSLPSPFSLSGPFGFMGLGIHF